MNATDPALLRAMVLSGGLLYAMSAAIIIFGVFMVALSFRKSPK